MSRRHGPCAPAESLFDFRQLAKVRINPLDVRFPPGDFFLDLEVPQQDPLVGIDGNHLSGTEPSLLDDMRIIEFQRTDLGPQHDQAVGCYFVTCRTKPVPVEGGTDDTTVAEDQRRRTVPRLAETLVILVELSHLFVDIVPRPPRLGHEHHHRMEDGPAGKRQRFQGIIEMG